MSVVPDRLEAAYVLEGGSRVWSDQRRVLQLIRHLTRRHLALRYRGSVLGFFWSLLNPLLMMAIYTLVFQYILRLSEPGVPYPIFFLTGLLAWNFVHTATLNAAMALIDNYPLITKAAFPRITLPISVVLSNGVNYLVSIPVLVVFALLFGVTPGLDLLWLPLALVQLFAITIGLALIAASLTPFFRDLVQLIEVLFVGWFFATPILYPSSLPRDNLSESAYAMYQLNPMAGAISLVRKVFLGEAVPTMTLVASAAGSLGLLLVGVWLFRRLSGRVTSI